MRRPNPSTTAFFTAKRAREGAFACDVCVVRVVALCFSACAARRMQASRYDGAPELAGSRCRSGDFSLQPAGAATRRWMRIEGNALVRDGETAARGGCYKGAHSSVFSSPTAAPRFASSSGSILTPWSPRSSSASVASVSYATVPSSCSMRCTGALRPDLRFLTLQ